MGTSHRGFPKTKMPSGIQRQCRKRIKSENGEKIQLIIEELTIDNSPINHNECDEDKGHIKITDLSNKSKKPVLYCHHNPKDGDLDLIFGDDIILEFSTGDWATAGFSLRYLAE